MLVPLSLRSSIASAAPCPDNDLDGQANCHVAACNPSRLLWGDCNDADNQVYPGRAEVCNQKDDECDAVADERSADVSSHAAINDVGAKTFVQAGDALTGITDVTGDGVLDIVVGVQLHDGPTASFNDIGALELYSGRTRTLRCLMIDPSDAGGDQLGASLATIPDVMDDGSPISPLALLRISSLPRTQAPFTSGPFKRTATTTDVDRLPTTATTPIPLSTPASARPTVRRM